MRKIFKLPLDFHPGENKADRKEVILTHNQISNLCLREIQEGFTKSEAHLASWVTCLQVIAEQNDLNVIFLPFGIMGDRKDIHEMEEKLLLSIYLN